MHHIVHIVAEVYESELLLYFVYYQILCKGMAAAPGRPPANVAAPGATDHRPHTHLHMRGEASSASDNKITLGPKTKRHLADELRLINLYLFLTVSGITSHNICQ